MVLARSGPLTLADIAEEFDPDFNNDSDSDDYSFPYELSDFYAGASSGYVPSGTMNNPSGTAASAIPRSGPLKISDFYGAQRSVNPKPRDLVIDQITHNSARARWKNPPVPDGFTLFGVQISLFADEVISTLIFSDDDEEHSFTQLEAETTYTVRLRIIYRNAQNRLVSHDGDAITNADFTDPVNFVTLAPPSTMTLRSAATNISGNQIDLTFSHALDANSIPAASAFSTSPARTISNVRRASGTATNTLLLSVSPVFDSDDDITISYTKPSSNPIQDGGGNEADSFTNEDVTNNTAGITLAVSIALESGDSATPDVGSSITIESTVTGTALGAISYQWQRYGGNTYSGGQTNDDNWDDISNQTSATLTRSRSTMGSETYRLKVTRQGIQRTSASLTVTWLTSQTLTLRSAATNISGNQIDLTFSHALDANSIPAASAFSTSPARTISNVRRASGTATNTLLLSVSPVFDNDDDITISYTKPSSNPIQDAGGNEADSFTDEDVTNNTAGIILIQAPVSLRVDEGGTATISVRLSRQPLSSVTVTASESDADISVTPSSRTFTTRNWNTAQNFTVNGIHDNDAADDRAVITLTASGGSTDTHRVTVTVTDDDEPVTPPAAWGPWSVWTPAVSSVCARVTFTQRRTRSRVDNSESESNSRSATGTKAFGAWSNPSWSPALPAASSLCRGVRRRVTQRRTRVRTCSSLGITHRRTDPQTRTVTVTGTNDCSNYPGPSISISEGSGEVFVTWGGSTSGATGPNGQAATFIQSVGTLTGFGQLTSPATGGIVTLIAGVDYSPGSTISATAWYQYRNSDGTVGTSAVASDSLRTSDDGGGEGGDEP